MIFTGESALFAGKCPDMKDGQPSQSTSLDLPVRLRRLRRTPAIRALVAETPIILSKLVQPVFVTESDTPEPVASMPGIVRVPLKDIGRTAQDLQALGLGGIAIFPKIDAALKNEAATEALNPDTLVLRAIRALKQAAPDFPVFSDIALDPYTPHGHDGVLTADGTDVDNDATVEILRDMAVLHAQAGADFVAPSDMMDGRIAVIRAALDESGLSEVGIMAYSAKFASAYYGPFRDAVGSAKAKPLDKRTYQLSWGNRREAVREALLDADEGADILMVKPALPYLDILRDLREATDLPLAAYQVSGEYAQLIAAAHNGWLDLARAREESLTAIFRSGADFIFTYFAESHARDARGA